MATSLSLVNLAQFTRVAPTSTEAALPSRIRAVSPDIAALSLVRYQLLRLRDAIEEAAAAAGSSRLGRGGDVIGITSSSPLSLDNSTRAAVIESTEEINTAPTSFSPFGPDWSGSGASTALVTIGGVYDGSGGTGTLRFEARDTGVHGVQSLRIRVRNTNGSTLANVSVNAGDPLDQQYGLSNGLYFTLGAGTLVKKDELTVNVFDTVGSAVVTSSPFDGVRNANPNLDIGESIPGGTLTVNGVNVAVGAGDSVESMITAINQSTAGVTATFDAARERLVLTQNTPGATPTIAIDADDSGFASAAKLAGATVIPGRDADLDSPLANVTHFQGVQSGTIRVNQTPIAIDVQTDSLRDILDRINASQSEATAIYSEPPQQVRFSSNRTVTLDDGTTGFLASLSIPVGTFGVSGGEGLSSAQRIAIARSVERLTRRLSTVLSTASESSALRPLSARLGGLLSDAQRDLGLRLESGGTGARLDAQALQRNLGRNADATLQFLTGTESSSGLLDKLAASVETALATLHQQLGNVGSLVDRRA